MNIKKEIKHNFGYLKVKPTTNNIFLTLSDEKGNVIISKHAGSIKIKGTQKRTPFIAGQVCEHLLTELERNNINIKLWILQIDGFIKNNLVKTVVKKLRSKEKYIFYIEYIRRKAHNGLRKKKDRRL